jgi:glycosyltransferase involved in cell wall biosynthesis
MAAGTPVVASDIEVLQEVCCGAATLVPAEDPARWASALTSVIESRPLAAEHVAAGRAVATAASWARGGEALRELLVQVARGRTG